MNTINRLTDAYQVVYSNGRQMSTYFACRELQRSGPWTGCLRMEREGTESMEKIVKLSEAEWKVMSLLWEASPQTMMQLTKQLKETTGWTKHTVMTFLKRMEEKGAVRYEEGGRAKLYYPKIARKEAVLQETEEFLEKVFEGRMGLMLNTMVEQQALSREEISELYEILRQAEEKSREGGENR